METKEESLDKKKKGRDILALTVGEVSPVDRPANLQEFITIKRLEKENGMGAFDSNETESSTADDGYQWIDVDLQKSLGPELLNSTKPVTEFLEAVEKGETKDLSEEVLKALSVDLKGAIQRVVQFLGKVSGGKYPFPSPKPAQKAEETKKAIGEVVEWAEKIEKDLSGDLKGAVKNVVAFLKKAVEGTYEKPTEKADDPPAEPDKKPETEPVTKSDDDPPANLVELKADGSLLIHGEQIEKGKRFTTKRTGDIVSLAKSALSLLTEVAPDQAKSLITDIAKSAYSTEISWPTVTPAAPAQSTDVQKDLGETLTKALEPIKKGLEEKLDGVSGRLEKIEKTRQAPQGGDPDSTDSSATTEEDVWKGLPLPE